MNYSGGSAAPAPHYPGKKPSGFLPGGARSLPGYVFKFGLLGGVVALATYSLPQLYEKKLWFAFIGVVVSAGLILWVYLGTKRVHLKYLLPGTLLLLVFQVYPIAYLLQISFTNYGSGHLVNEQEAIATTLQDSVEPVAGAPSYVLAVATKANPAVPSAPFVFFLTGPRGKVYIGNAAGLRPVAPRSATLAATGQVIAAPGYHFLNPIEINNLGTRLEDYSVPVGPNDFIRSLGVSTAYVGRATMRYDSRANTLYDVLTKTTYRAERGSFVATNGSGAVLAAGWKAGVGFSNYSSVLTDGSIRGPFLKILAWDISFAVLSVASSFLLGLVLALALNHQRLRGRSIYRSVFLLPYAMPAFISILVWASLFNQQFGLIDKLFGFDVNWLGNEWWAKLAILVTNLWLGFPYMFLVSTGFLQSVPPDLVEAAHVDGAGGMAAVRHITLPLLLTAIEPLLVSSFAFNFNNFNIIEFLTGGGPFTYGSSLAGSTDLVISYTYRLSFGGQGAQYGFSAVLAVFLFIIVGAMSVLALRRSKAFRTMG